MAEPKELGNISITDWLILLMCLFGGIGLITSLPKGPVAIYAHVQGSELISTQATIVEKYTTQIKATEKYSFRVVYSIPNSDQRLKKRVEVKSSIYDEMLVGDSLSVYFYDDLPTVLFADIGWPKRAGYTFISAILFLILSMVLGFWRYVYPRRH